MKQFIFPLVMAMVVMLVSKTAITKEIPGADENFSAQETQRMIQLIRNNQLDELKRYIKSGVDVDTPGKDGSTVMLWAMLSERPEAVKALLDLGADPRIPLNKDINPLCWAPRMDSTVYLKIFLDKGADPNYWCRSNNLLMNAVFEGRKDNVRLLHKSGASFSAKNEFGFDAIEQTLGRYEIMVYLLENGYDGDTDKLRRSLEMTYMTPEYPNYSHFVKALELVDGDIKNVQAWVTEIDRRNALEKRGEIPVGECVDGGPIKFCRE